MSDTTMSEHKFTKVLVERNDEKENYTIHGLPENKDFRNAESYVELTACWLKVNGVGFACNQCEFSEYETTITVEQQNEGGSARITF